MAARLYWFIRRESDNAILGRDKKWYHMLNVERVKTYKSPKTAVRHGLRSTSGTAYAIYANQLIDAVGNIYNEDGTSVGKDVAHASIYVNHAAK